MARFLFALVALVFIEIVVFVKAGERIGAVGVASLTIVSAGVGLFIVRRQGIRLLERAWRMLAAGTPPVSELGEGLFLALAGLCLLLPGLVTDAVGGLLLIPPLRRALVVLVAGPEALRREPTVVVLDPDDYEVSPQPPERPLAPWDDRP